MVPLAQALARRGHMVRLVIPPWDDPSAQEAAKAGQTSVGALVSSGEESKDPSGVHTVALALPRRAPASITLTYGLLRQALRPNTGIDAPFESGPQLGALRALTTFSADVVHVFKPVGYSGLAGFALSAMRAKWVLDVDDWEGPGGWADINSYSLAERASVTLMEALLPRLARAVTAASRTLEARTWNMGLPRQRVGFLPNGVSREKYAAWGDYTKQTGPLQWEQRGLPAEIRKQYRLEGAPVVLLYTRFAEYPYTWALRILAKVLEQHPGARLFVVGSGFRGEEERLRADAAAAGMGEQVVVAGRVPENLLPAYLSLGDVAVYPMADTLLNRAKSPMKVIEPMVMGLPIVAHRVGSVAEFIGDTGLLVPPGNLEGMAAGVSRLLSNPNLRSLLGAKAQQRVWSRFNWDDLSGIAERMYTTALG
jgi:glycosyltransferase involved in cell wall biosynthesis